MTVERFFIEEAKKAQQIEDFLKKELDVAGFSHAEVKRTPLGTRIIIHALRPGLVIGSGGEKIKKLTNFVGNKFKVDNPHLEVEQVKDQFLDPHIVAWRIARSLERGTYFKRIANIMMTRVTQAGAKGVEIRLGGKLPGARAKSWIFTEGKLRKCGQDAIDLVKVGYARAVDRMGTTGIKVSILPPGVRFSDEIYDREEVKANQMIKIKKTKPKTDSTRKEDGKKKNKDVKSVEGNKEVPKKEVIKESSVKQETVTKEGSKEEVPKQEKVPVEQK